MKNKKLFKNIVITLFLLAVANFAYANSYIMISPVNISEVNMGTANFLNFHILSTLDNSKKSLIISSSKNGEGSFTIKLKNNKKCDYKVIVKDGKMAIKGDSTIKVLQIDVPPELTEDYNK